MSAAEPPSGSAVNLRPPRIFCLHGAGLYKTAARFILEGAGGGRDVRASLGEDCCSREDTALQFHGQNAAAGTAPLRSFRLPERAALPCASGGAGATSGEAGRMVSARSCVSIAFISVVTVWGAGASRSGREIFLFKSMCLSRDPTHVEGISELSTAVTDSTSASVVWRGRRPGAPSLCGCWAPAAGFGLGWFELGAGREGAARAR